MATPTATVPGGTSTPADAGATASSPGATEGAADIANPGGAASYGAPVDTAITGSNVFAGLTDAVGSMPMSIPSSLETAQIPDTINGSAARPLGYGKGTKAPNVTRLSDLVKLVTAIDNGTPLGGFDSQVIQAVSKAAKVSPQDVAALMKGASGDTKVAEAAGVKMIQAGWKQITQHLESLGVSVPNDLLSAPNGVNLRNKIKALGAVTLEHPTLDALDRNGFNTDGIANVKALVTGHDSQQFATGAPGATKPIPGTPAAEGRATGASLWDDFVTKWNANPTVNGQKFRTSTLQALAGVGAIDLTQGTPTAATVAAAYQGVMTQAAGDSLSVNAEFQKLHGQVPKGPQGQDINNENVSQAYVTHVADQILGPNILTQFQAQAIANLANKVGTGSAAADDLINQAVVNVYQQRIQNGGAPVTEGSSYAAIAYQNVNDTLAKWGIALTPQQIAQMVAAAPAGSPPGTDSILQTGVNTPYQINTLAQTAAEGYAKQQVPQMFGAGVGALAAQGQDVATTAQPYLGVAANLLGVPVPAQALTDPTGKWMKWSQGGTGPGGMMTTDEWAKYLMADPQYGYASSQTAKNVGSEGAQGLLSLFGKLPQSQSNPFGSVQLPTQFGAS